MQGVPGALKQEEVNDNKSQTHVRGTVKEAVFESDPDWPNIVVSFVYDSKTMKFLFTTTESITWVEKEKLVFS